MTKQEVHGTMKRVAKREGKYNIVIEEAPKPDPEPGEVLIKARKSLISRGSELGSRYTVEHAVPPEKMGYSLAGKIDVLGAEVEHFTVGDAVVALAPHAQYVLVGARPQGLEEQVRIASMVAGMSFEAATLYPLTAGAVAWVKVEDIQPDAVVVVMGQGLVGSLVMQVAKSETRGFVVAVDATAMRCELAAKLGADVVVNAAEEDPVGAVKRITAGRGAEVVVYAVGGPAGPKAFEQGMSMLAPGGTFHHIGLNEKQTLPLTSAMIQRKKIVGGYFRQVVGARESCRAMALLASGTIQTDLMITHRFPYLEAAEAFDLLQNRMEDTLGVILDFEAE